MDETTNDILMHYGVLGMKWGIRRYQNYDGSYTKKGLERYHNAETRYEEAKKKAQTTKAAYKIGNSTRQQVKESKSAVKVERRKMEKAYGKLKTDKLADEGKKLYQRGKTINGNTKITEISEAAIILGSSVVSSLLQTTLKDTRISAISGTTLAVGGTVINAILAGKTASENKKLRAYYAH